MCSWIRESWTNVFSYCRRQRKACFLVASSTSTMSVACRGTNRASKIALSQWRAVFVSVGWLLHGLPFSRRTVVDCVYEKAPTCTVFSGLSSRSRNEGKSIIDLNSDA